MADQDVYIDMNARRQISELQDTITSIEKGGGGPHDPGMEPRIAKIEATLEHVALKEDIAKVNGRIDTLTERVSHLPTKTFIVTSLLLSLAVISALIVFQGHVQEVAGIMPSPRPKP